ncbi:nSTAND3 domain-containing NTPase [Roseomonas sp. WA12]
MKESSTQSVDDSLFRLSVSAKQAFAHPQWRRARRNALEALQRGRSVVLVGLPGTGKTLLLRDLAQSLRKAGLSVRLTEPSDLLNKAKKREILLLDEAASMQTEQLACVCNRADLSILVALPDFAEQLAKLDCAFVEVALEPLQPEDVALYVAASLETANQPTDLLEPDAIQALADRSQGLLRIVNALGAGAVFLRNMEGAAHVTQRHVEEAYLLRQGAGAQLEPASTPIDRRTVLSGSKIEPSSSDELSAAATATPRPVPRADATVQVALASSLTRSNAASQRRAKLLGSLSAGLAVALLGGLVLQKTPRQEGWVQPDGSDSTLGPATPGTLDTTQTPPNGPDPLSVQSQGPSAAGDAPTVSPETSPPRQDRAMAAQSGSRTLGSPAETRPPRRALRTDAEGIVSFRGTVFNETMGQGGRLTLTVRQGPGRTVFISFEASNGLVGAGELAGSLAQDGRITASGTLMMGRNRHECELTGVMTGTSLTGAATFQRSASNTKARSTFNLIRS